VIARTNYREMYYSAAQQLCAPHHQRLPDERGRPAGVGHDLGPEKDSRGSLLELSWGGKEPLAIAGGTRTFLQDGDTVILRGHAQGDGFRIGFGECAGQVIAAHADPVGAGR
jgi:fumarylacetoacetase